MWLMTQYGFYSVVKHRDETDRYLVRARVKNDLKNLLELVQLDVEIHESPSADYPYRIFITSEQLITVLEWLGKTVNYDNFKSRIHRLPDQQDKGDAYLKVWSALNSLNEPNHQDDNKLRPGWRGLPHQPLRDGEEAMPPVTAKDIDVLLQYLPTFEQRGYKFGEWSQMKGTGTSEEPYILPYWSSSQEVSQFIEDLHRLGFMLHFDWGAWEQEANRLQEEPEHLRAADLTTLRKIWTAHVRADRFVTNHLASVFDSGHITDTLRRLKQIRATMQVS